MRIPSGWHALAVPKAELRLHVTLENGQCFGWTRQPGDDPVWVGVFGRRLLALKEVEDDCLFRCLSGSQCDHTTSSSASPTALADELRDYFQLSTPLQPLYKQWSSSDERMATVAQVLPGMRILRQEPVECLFSFICSSNNNIARIGGMLQALRRTYGTPIDVAGAHADADADAASVTAETPPLEPVGHGDAREFYTFPSAESLAAASEEDLRALGLGYRAAYIRQTATILCERGERWLPSLRDMKEPEAVRQMLCELPGVGPKVADCVALFSLDQHGAIPVDTHVWDIACRDLDPTLTNCGSLTPKVYDRVGSLFRSRYGSHAGWAHSVLFAGELPLYRALLPEDVQSEMAAFRDEAKRARQEEKQARAEAKASGNPFTPSRPYQRPPRTSPGTEGASSTGGGKQGADDVTAEDEATGSAATPAASSAAPVKRKRTVTPKRRRSSPTAAVVAD